MANYLKEKLFKTRENIFGRIKNFISGRDVTREISGDLEEIMISADISPKTTGDIIKNAFADLRSRKKEDFIDDVKTRMLSMLGSAQSSGGIWRAKPLVVMVIGVNGVGKTTTIGKIARAWTEEGKTGILGACDTFRAAAVEQLAVWGEKTGCRVVRQKIGGDPASVAFDSVEAAVSQGKDFILLDTAGRLHTKHNLMEELKKIKRVLCGKNTDYPHEIWLVLDATFGQNALVQVGEFKQAVDITGIIMTKLDGTAKGGTLLTIANEYKIPVTYIGVGEGENDLVPFSAAEYVDAIFS